MEDHRRLVVTTGLVCNDYTDTVDVIEVRDDQGREVLVDDDGRTFVLVDGRRRDVAFTVTVSVR
jgi:hypothetical protein